MVTQSHKQRITILGHSATSVLKYMGREGYSTADAKLVVEKLASAPLAPSSIATALSDGKNVKYNGNAAELTVREVRQLKKATKSAK